MEFVFRHQFDVRIFAPQMEKFITTAWQMLVVYVDHKNWHTSWVQMKFSFVGLTQIVYYVKLISGTNV